eukprot:1007144-Rhodomonas_salina.3
MMRREGAGTFSSATATIETLLVFRSSPPSLDAAALRAHPSVISVVLASGRSRRFVVLRGSASLG